jgi:uncharacterized membrane protein YgcG
MSVNRIAIFNQVRGKQRGVALIIMLVILVVGVAAVLINSLTSSKVNTARQETTAAALAQAKDALIGRAIADANRPGSLPCPDLLTNISGTNIPNDGVADLLSGNNCPSYIGRLPWKTLGLPDLRDGSGERLWYALSPNFRDDNSNSINSNSKGTLLVYDNSGTTLLTPPGSEAVAIVFAAGNVVASQLRDTANQNLPQNYLDVGPNGINNATAGGPFIAAATTSSFNDTLMIIRASDIITNVEMRVAKELTTVFANYLPTNGGKYPYPARFASCTSASCPGDSLTPTCIGKIPATDLATFLPAWFTPNNWFDVIYYTAGTASLPGGGGGGGGGGGKKGKGKKGGGGGVSGGGGSPGCTPFLSILDANGNPLAPNNASALFLLPDTPLGSITRTSMSSINLTDYFEDAENQNLDNLYIMPTAISNDSLYILP